MRIRPAEGRAVRRPEPPYDFLPPEGDNVQDSPYWRRRLVRGTVVLVDATPPSPAPAGEE